MDLLHRYVDTAVRFAARQTGDTAGRPMRVAATLATCRLATMVLNELHVPEERESVYRYVNVHNPRSPLFFDRARGCWSCDPQADDLPVWGINWAGALLICRYLGGRLPTTREWEHFASNNDPARTYPWGCAEPTEALANYGEHLGGPSPVGSFPPSELGLYDLAGNLNEWCQDRCGDGERVFERAVKGGAWSKGPGSLKIAATHRKWERIGTTTIGVRPVWDA
ncbi:formylglycine-generating enzyme family protein [Schlegelella sp. S2-27]|uniref:Formylglycine-generating enzyme family protein n=1 Tax=Caldimonas mangrovi TaxID=2944811 RepID=A0ABT0YI96_9BURK|nr:SUMF1/EgtB/PvdO family nonheme iron enzyme [Caldimonas mangrovi]MCM5678456.1 formylglycine-generating enzyme family protein [Caldimonas mangrovi]